MDDATRAWTAAVALLLASSLLLGPAHARGQVPGQGQGFETGLQVTPRVGLAIPAGELSGFLTYGPTVGLAVSHYFSDRAAVTVDADVEALPGKNFGATRPPGPDTRLWHLTAGGLLRFTNPEEAPGWVTTMRGGLGLTVLETDPFGPVTNPFTGEVVNSFSEMYLGGRVGFTLGYQVTPGLRLSAGTDLRVFAAREEATAALQQAARLVPGGIAAGVSVPVFLGGQLSL